MAKQIFSADTVGEVTRVTDVHCEGWSGYSYFLKNYSVRNYVCGEDPGGCVPYTSIITRAFMEFDASSLIPSLVSKVVLRVYINTVFSSKTRYVYVLDEKPSDYSYSAQLAFSKVITGDEVWSGSVSTGWIEYDLGSEGIAALSNDWLAVGLIIDETLDGNTGYTYYRSKDYTSYKPELIVYWRRRIAGG